MKKKSKMPKQVGIHLIADLCECENLDNKNIKNVLLEAVKLSGATLVSVKICSFSPTGASGVAVIAESHISIHTWPEYNYAAVDIFTCGPKMKPKKALPAFKKAFKPKLMQITELKRGVN